MKIGRIRSSGGPSFAVQADGRWVTVDQLGVEAETTADVIANASQVRIALGRASGGDADPEFLAPVVKPSKVMAIGQNYLEHIRETGRDRPEYPVIFAKFPSAINDPYGDIVVDPDLTERADYEVELAVVIGRRTRRVRREDALASVFGYTVANDVSARDWQRRDVQNDRSKSFDTFCPIGPWITTADEVQDPQQLELASRVNGELRQHSSTADMLFSVEHLIWYIARGMTLEPGDVILTGTPRGVGVAMDPPRFLAAGDVVECEVEGLGGLRNRVVAPSN